MAQNLTPQEIATIKATRFGLALNRALVLGIVAYGAYECWTAYTPLAPWLFGIFAGVVYLMRPALPEAIRAKLKPD